MNNVAEHVRKNFNGMMVVGDIHADFDTYMHAYNYASEHNLFLMLQGDLVDRGSKPFETVSHVASLMKEGKAGFTIGNHDNKFHRHAKGNKVNFSRDGNATLVTVGEDRMQEFLQLYVDIIETPVLSAFYHVFDDNIVVHAACHPCMWDSKEKFSKSAEARMMYGETNGKMMDDGYPIRLYNWINEVPRDKIVIVGHDRMPIFNVPITTPMIRPNIDGGTVIFMDTGCGKGGFLSGAVLTDTEDGFKINRFMEFK